MAQLQQPNIPQMPPYYYPPRRRRWWIPVLIIGIVFLLFVLPILVFLGLAGSFFSKEPVEVRSNSVLYLDLGMKLDEYSGGNPIQAIFGETSASYNDVLQAIRRAKSDDKIKGIYYKAGGTQMGYAKNLELIDALADFKKSGKFIFAYFEMGTESDYLRSLPADKIFMPSEGMMSLNGFGINTMFFKGLLDKIGIEFTVQQFEDYKSAGEMYSRKNFSDSTKKEYRVILNQRHNSFVDAVSKFRKLDKDMINNVLNRGVYTADSLLALGFIDSLASELEVKEMMKSLTNKHEKDSKKSKLRLVGISDYLNNITSNDAEIADKDKQIAIIYAVGPIVDQESNNFNTDKQITKKLATYIKQAREDKKIKAIILRVDSPGGSVMASDAIWSEVYKTRGVKPIYSSMSDVAASGGYYISMACDTIIAHPSTLTGSIGVIVSIPNINGLLKKLDITSDTLSTTAAAQDLSVNYPFNAKQLDKLHNLSKSVYFRFVNKVAQGRHKTFEETRALAKGRVWSGEDAKKYGLVDTLGGLQTAINIAKRRLGISENVKIRIREYPEKEDEVEAILKLFKISRHNDEDTRISSLLEEYFTSKNLSVKDVYDNIPELMKLQLKYTLSLLQISQKEPVMVAMPDYIDIR